MADQPPDPGTGGPGTGDIPVGGSPIDGGLTYFNKPWINLRDQENI